jgi:hypothetical protein
MERRVAIRSLSRMQYVSIFGVARGGGLTFCIAPARTTISLFAFSFSPCALAFSCLGENWGSRHYNEVEKWGLCFIIYLCHVCVPTTCRPFSCETLFRPWSSKVRLLCFWAISRIYWNEVFGRRPRHHRHLGLSVLCTSR